MREMARKRRVLTHSPHIIKKMYTIEIERKWKYKGVDISPCIYYLYIMNWVKNSFCVLFQHSTAYTINKNVKPPTLIPLLISDMKKKLFPHTNWGFPWVLQHAPNIDNLISLIRILFFVPNPTNTLRTISICEYSCNCWIIPPLIFSARKLTSFTSFHVTIFCLRILYVRKFCLYLLHPKNIPISVFTQRHCHSAAF